MDKSQMSALILLLAYALPLLFLALFVVVLLVLHTHDPRIGY